MSCSRKNCDSIMCHTYVNSVGYACTDCQKEFKEYLQSQRISVNSDREINTELEKFMETSKGEYTKGKEMNVSEFFRSFTND